MILADVAREIATQLATIIVRSTPYAPESIEPPAAYVFGPETEYHQSYQNGLTRAQWAITVAMPPNGAEANWEALAGYCSDTGDTSVKACLEGGTYTAMHTLIVLRSKIGEVTLAGATYPAAQFDLDITGSGA